MNFVAVVVDVFKVVAVVLGSRGKLPGTGTGHDESRNLQDVQLYLSQSPECIP